MRWGGRVLSGASNAALARRSPLPLALLAMTNPKKQNPGGCSPGFVRWFHPKMRRSEVALNAEDTGVVVGIAERGRTGRNVVQSRRTGEAGTVLVDVSTGAFDDERKVLDRLPGRAHAQLADVEVRVVAESSRHVAVVINV